MGYIQQLGKNSVFQTLRHYKNYIFEIFTLSRFLSHIVTSCDIVTWALKDEIKPFNISKLYFDMVMISKHVKSFK